MSSRPMLTGSVEPEYIDDRDAIIEGLRSQNRKLDEALRIERIKTGAIEHALRELTRLTKPFLQLLRAIHGEIDAVGIQDASPSSDSRTKAAWGKWIEHFGSGSVVSRFIEAFLEHGELDADQLNILTKCGKGNVPTYIHRMKKADLIRKNGSKFSLKEI